jgi:hypothetical protein
MRNVSFRRAKRPFRILRALGSGGGPKHNGRFVVAAGQNEIFVEETEVAKVARKRTQALGIIGPRKLVRYGENRSGRQAQKAGCAGLKAE